MSLNLFTSGIFVIRGIRVWWASRWGIFVIFLFLLLDCSWWKNLCLFVHFVTSVISFNTSNSLHEFWLIIRSFKNLFFNFLQWQVSQHSWNWNSFKDEILNFSIRFFLIFLILSRIIISFFTIFLFNLNVFINNFLKFLPFFTFRNTYSNNKLENIPISEHMDFLSSEKLVNIENISPQEIQSMWMIMFDRLWHIDYMNLVLPIKHIILTEISMNKSTLLIKQTHFFNNIEVDFWKLLYITIDISNLWCWLHIFTNKVHYQYIWFDSKSNWRWHDTLNSFKISKLFFSPFCHHLSGVWCTISSSESELSTDISVSIFEDQDWCFVNFDSILFFCNIIYWVVNVGLFTSWKTTIDFMYCFIIEEFQ